MQYKGVYACGHEGTVKIRGGKAADREWKANTSDSFVYAARYDGSNERQNERRFFETGR